MQRLKINGVDFTAKWRPDESSWTQRAYMGQSMTSKFVLDDDDGTIDHADVASAKIVTVEEDASGDWVTLYRGRMQNHSVHRGNVIAGVAARWTLQAEDSNIDARDIRVDDSNRPEESDRERVLAMRAGYLDGASSTNDNARDSTEIAGTYVPAADLVTMPAETYTDTYPNEVFNRICEISAKTWFVYVADDGTMHLYYAVHTDTGIESDIEIWDNDPTVLDDDPDRYAPDRSITVANHDGQSLISGGAVRYGADGFYEYSHAGSEADHDKRERTFTDQYIVNEASAQAFLENMVASLNNEEFSFTARIRMTAANVHRLKAGMMTPIRLVAANLPTVTTQRAVEVTVEPKYKDGDGEWIYWVTATFGLPRTKPFPRKIRTLPPPVPPTPTTPPGPETPGIPSLSLRWTFTGTLLDDGTSTYDLADSTVSMPTGTYNLTGQWGHQHGLSNRHMTPRAPCTAGETFRLEGDFSTQRASTLATSTITVYWYSVLAGGSPISSTTVSIPASGAGLGVVGSVDQSFTVPVGATYFSLLPANNLFLDNVEVTITGAGTPGATGVAGSGLAELVGTANIYARVDHKDSVVRDTAPTVTDDEEHGFPEGTVWFVVDDTATPTTIFEVWYLLDNTDGAAVWGEWPEPEDEEGQLAAVSLTQTSTMHRFPVWGHRGDIGSSDSLPENTLESVRQAALKGAQGAEIDVRLSSDGTFYLMHDATLDRTTNLTGNISSATDATLNGGVVNAGYGWISGTYAIPTLVSVLEAINPYDFVLSIQLNASSIGNASDLAQLILDGGWAHRCVIEVSTLAEAATIKTVAPALTVMVNNVVSGAAGDVNVDWLSMERGTVTSLSVVTALAPQHVKSYITINDFPADETSIIQNMWDRGVSAYQSANLDFALAARRALLYGGGASPTTFYKPVSTGDPSDPGLLFIDGEVVMMEVPIP